MSAVRLAVVAAGSVVSPSWVPVPLADERDGPNGSGVDGGWIGANNTSGDKERDRGLVALAFEARGMWSWEFDAPNVPRL